MTGRHIETLRLAVVDGLHNLADTTERTLVQALHPGSVAQVPLLGEYRPQTFSPRSIEEEGGHSRFLPALAMGVSAVHGSSKRFPVDRVFEEMHANQQQEGNIHRSERTVSTRLIIKQLQAGDLECLDGIEIEECAEATRTSEARETDMYSPLTTKRQPRAALVMPVTWQLLLDPADATRADDDELIRIAISPLWTAVTGGKTVEGGSGDHHVDPGLGTSFFRVAFPVREPDAPDGTGFVRTVPGMTFSGMFKAPYVKAPGAPKQPNIAYKVSKVKAKAQA